nr:MAG TPA: Transcription initiation factor IIE, alpha FINGER, Transcription [Caudoviricetes sp.]
MSKPYTHVTLPQCRPDGPFEFIERIRLPDGKTRIRARCKRCGNVFIRSRTFFYNSRNQSCGCAHHAQRNEAIREKISESQRSIPHKCSICGAEFQGGTNVKYCPKCRKAARTTYMRNFERRKLGWTEEEIRLGHRLTTKP